MKSQSSESRNSSIKEGSLMNFQTSCQSKNQGLSSMMNSYLKGAISGAFGAFVSHPFDTLRIRKQENRILNRGLYNGVTPSIISIALEKSIVFGTYDLASRYVNTFLAGCISGFTCSFIVSPCEKIKILRQQNLTYKQIISSPTSGIFNGLSATFFRETPGFGIYFSTYNYLKELNLIENKYLSSFVYGGLSGVFSWIFIYPQDRIKTHMQSTGRTLKQTIMHMNNTEFNIKNLYRGFSFTMYRASALHSSVFLVYELIKD